jgi:periplasmic protein TonB
MSFVDQQQDFRRRAAAIAGVAAIHAAIGASLLIGLTVTGVAPPIDTWDPFEITPDPLPKSPPPEPSPPQASNKSVVVIPPTPLPPLGPPDNALVETAPTNASTVVAVVDGPVIGPTPAPLQAALFTPRGARPANNPGSWLSNDDSPAVALRAEAEGLASYRLIVGTNGRVSACDVTRSTGNNALDQATCKFIVRRARFEAATDEAGAKVVGNYSGTVRWDIPD